MEKFPHLKGKIINDLVENLDLAKLTLDYNFDTIISSYAEDDCKSKRNFQHCCKTKQ